RSQDAYRARKMSARDDVAPQETTSDPQPRPGGPPTVAEMLRALRKRAGLTQADAAAKGGVTRDHIALLETGRNQASSARTRAALARAFELHDDTLADLLDGKLELAQALDRVGERRQARSRRLADRDEWPRVLAAARALHTQFYGSVCTDE